MKLVSDHMLSKLYSLEFSNIEYIGFNKEREFILSEIEKDLEDDEDKDL